MAQEEEKKEEEKFEFDAAGEALGYISLDQARLRAMQHARDNTDFYGRRYARRELVWEAVSEEEGEDYYQVRLSYRPSRGFSGEPGLEQFTIDKAGPIEFRQILSEPRPVRSRFLIPAVLVGVLISAGAVVGILFGTGVFGGGETLLPPELVTIMVMPGSSAELVSPGGGVTATLAPGAVDRPAQLTYLPVPSGEVPLAPTGFLVSQQVFDLTLSATDGSDQPSLSGPLTIALELNPVDVTKVDPISWTGLGRY